MTRILEYTITDALPRTTGAARSLTHEDNCTVSHLPAGADVFAARPSDAGDAAAASHPSAAGDAFAALPSDAMDHRTSETEPPLTVGDFLRSRGYSHRIIARLKRQNGGICKNGAPVRVCDPLLPGDVLTVCLEEKKKEEGSWEIIPQNLPLHIVYEDDDLFVLDKEPGMPVHPSAGHHEGTLANALAFYTRQLGSDEHFRCINRLDKDTSGLLICARNALSADILSSAMKRREIGRTYLALVKGKLEGSGVIDAPIARVPGSALMRCVDYNLGERAVTCYEAQRYIPERDLTLVQLRLQTGRTHQIRVHMQHIGHPLPGDFLYCPDYSLIGRQALHSCALVFRHPITGEEMSFTSPLPQDMAALLS